MVIESPTREFKPTKGLKNGDLLTPFLFSIIGERLYTVVRQTTK